MPRLTSSPSRATNESGSFGSLSFSGTSACQPASVRPSKSECDVGFEPSAEQEASVRRSAARHEIERMGGLSLEP